MAADDPQQKIELRTFHCEIINDHKALQQEQESYQEIPVFRSIDSSMVKRNYIQIKEDLRDIVTYEMERILNDPALEHLESLKKGRDNCISDEIIGLDFISMYMGVSIIIAVCLNF